MKVNPITVLIAAAFLYPLLKGFLYMYSSNNIKMEIDDINKDITFIISLFLGVYLGKKIFIQHDEGTYRNIYNMISPNIKKYLNEFPAAIYVVIIPLLCFIIYKIIMWILRALNQITIYPVLDAIERWLSRCSNIVRRIFGMLVELPKSICYVLLLTFLLNIVTMLHVGGILNPYLETSGMYRYICKEAIIPITNSSLAKQLPNVIGNSFKVVVHETQPGNTPSGRVSSRTIIYYNGVTIDEGIRSDAQIDDFARRLAGSKDTTQDKAKIIYEWVGKNIDYDNEKAKKVMANDYDVKSGAIPTFESRKGICFDYACLYTAMCRANKIKVRIITGEGFNGVSWVSHAWNQVYIPESDKWINVDTTFSKGGNYFNSRRFDFDHKNAQIAGEW